MATLDELNLSQAGTLPPELFAQQQALNRQQQMASMLMQQNQQPQGQMVSGRYVAPSWTQQLAPVANLLTGAYLAKQGDTKAAELAQQLRQGRQSEQQAVMEAINAGDTKGALGLASGSQYGGGKEFVPALIGSVIPKTPESVTEYNIAKQEGFKGSYNDFKNQMTPYQQAQLGIEKSRLGIAQQQLANEMGGAKLTESQSHAGAFQNAAVDAYRNMAGLEKAGFNPASTVNQTKMQLAGGGLNMFASPETQQYKQAQDQFANAYLRFQSGANMSEPEIQRNLKNMMPALGDKPDVVEQKRHAREEAIKSMGLAAGPANILRQNPDFFKQAPATPAAPPATTQQATPSLWGQATVVK